MVIVRSSFNIAFFGIASNYLKHSPSDTFIGIIKICVKIEVANQLLYSKVFLQFGEIPQHLVLVPCIFENFGSHVTFCQSE